MKEGKGGVKFMLKNLRIYIYIALPVERKYLDL